MRGVFGVPSAAGVRDIAIPMAWIQNLVKGIVETLE